MSVSSRKWPASTIRSASSSTRKATELKLATYGACPPLIISHRRPGVATTYVHPRGKMSEPGRTRGGRPTSAGREGQRTTSGVYDSSRCCFCMATPPTIGTMRTPRACLATADRCSHTCSASSRVGHNTKAVGPDGAGASGPRAARAAITPCSNGRPNASVLPEPVSDEPTTSLPLFHEKHR
jgi:hypothetical protein